MFPFEPTLPPLVVVLLGGLVAGLSVAELKLLVTAPPNFSELQPRPCSGSSRNKCWVPPVSLMVFRDGLSVEIRATGEGNIGVGRR